MNFSAKTEYACIALLELAATYGSGEPVRIRDIADRHGVPSRFLVQILLQLKGSGLVASTRGASGGYQLIREPAEISLGEVVAIIEGPPSPPTSSATRASPISRALLAAWRCAAESQDQTLNAISLASLLEQAQSQRADMYYI